jgi:hypothetical protein
MEATVPAANATQADIDRLAKHYSFRDPEAVAAFVREHPEVVAPLLEAVAVVPRYFGPGKELVLEVERDREARDHRQLFALIQTDQDVDAALASLERFEWEWWLDALPRAEPHLIYHIEFV